MNYSSHSGDPVPDLLVSQLNKSSFVGEFPCRMTKNIRASDAVGAHDGKSA